ncbi:MAG: redox-regulated ATPase YchF [bacterium]|nr:redox-regulated ATPase YchF [bacterium]
MQLGILGLAKAGKTTLFNILTSSRQDTDKFSASQKTHIAVAKVPDPRLARLRDLFEPRRYVPATVEYYDIPGIQKGGGPQSLDLAQLRTVDALVHVVRAFEDPELPHPDGSVDPERDVETVDLELILADHEVVERRLERLAKSAKGGLSDDEAREQKLLRETVLPALEQEKPLRDIELGPEEEKRLRGFQLLSSKPILIVLNVSEDRVAADRPADLDSSAGGGGSSRRVIVSAPIEDEISQLSPEEQQEFLQDLGLEEPSLDRVLRASFELLGRIAFFTVGEDEVRAWTIRRGTRAREAAGTIHSDLARGFIRAEVIAWDELLRVGSMAAARDQGVLRLEGKEYVVADGEVVHVRFNV